MRVMVERESVTMVTPNHQLPNGPTSCQQAENNKPPLLPLTTWSIHLRQSLCGSLLVFYISARPQREDTSAV